MELTELELISGNYKRFVYQTSDNLELETLYISFNQQFDKMKIVSQYPSVVVFISTLTQASLSLWNVRDVNIQKGSDSDIFVFTMLALGEHENSKVTLKVKALKKI